MARNIRILGVGSYHGDDQAGWIVTDQLAAMKIPQVACSKLSTPFDLVEMLSEASTIHVVDAGFADVPYSTMSLDCGNDTDRKLIDTCAYRGTHDFGIEHTLSLAESLGRPVDHVTLWLAMGESFEPNAPPSHRAQQSIDECVKRISEEVRHARTLTR